MGFDEDIQSVQSGIRKTLGKIINSSTSFVHGCFQGIDLVLWLLAMFI